MSVADKLVKLDTSREARNPQNINKMFNIIKPYYYNSSILKES